MCNKTKDVKV